MRSRTRRGRKKRQQAAEAKAEGLRENPQIQAAREALDKEWAQFERSIKLDPTTSPAKKRVILTRERRRYLKMRRDPGLQKVDGSES